MKKTFILMLINMGSIVLCASFLFLSSTANANAPILFCQGQFPGYGYRVHIDNTSQVSILSTTSYGRFAIGSTVLNENGMISLFGELIGTQHRWREQRWIRVSQNFWDASETTGTKILELSGVPFFCTVNEPANFM